MADRRSKPWRLTTSIKSPPSPLGPRAHRRATRHRSARHRRPAATRCGKGQRVGIFGGSGVGKSTLLGAMPQPQFRRCPASSSLIGEGAIAKCRAFLEHELGPEGMKRCRRRGCDLRSARACSREGLLCRSGNCRILPRSGGRCPDGDGLNYAPGDGPTGDWFGGRRAPQSKRLYALGFQPPAPRSFELRRRTSPEVRSRASSPFSWRATTSTQASIRRGARHPRRPHHPVAAKPGAAAITRRSTF